MITIGDFDIISVQTGTVRLDGGAMFGVVPKVVWERHEDVDELNRILLATRTLIAASRDRKTIMLVDTGAGAKWSAKEASRFDVRYDRDAIPNALNRHFSRTADDVTDVIVTHLHFDHNGGLTEWVNEETGDTRLCFPNAKHWMHQDHWDHARSPNDRDRASFLSRDTRALASGDVLHTVHGDNPAAPWRGVRFFVSCGHTPSQLLPIFHDDAHQLIFTGDVIPTGSHLRLPWVMAYDLQPLKTMAEKDQMLSRCRDKNAWLAFPHDHRIAGATVDFSNGHPVVGETLDL